MSEKQKVRRAFYRIRAMISELDKNGCKCNNPDHAVRHFKKPVVTVCLLKDEEGNVAKGYAICSKMDSFDNKKGKFIAEQRAYKALKEQKPSSPVNYWKALATLGLVWDHFSKSNLEYKCEFNPELTEQDKKSLRTTSVEIML